MDIKEFMKTKRKPDGSYPRIFCKDGFSMSIYASAEHSCVPKVDNAKEYFMVEVRFPVPQEDMLWAYYDTLAGMGIYTFVPVDVVQQIVDKHGGLDMEKIENSN